MKKRACRLLLFLATTALAVAASAATQDAPQRLTADTPQTTVAGNTFIAPAGWSVSVRGPATILEPPEGQGAIALVDVTAPDADAAVTAAWKAYKPDASWPLKVTHDRPDRNGWSKQKAYDYQTSPNEKRDVGAIASFADGRWTVVIYDMAQAVGEKRGAQVALIFDRLLPKGYVRETFAGKKAHKLDAAKLAELGRFIETGQKELGVPGVSVGIVQDGKVVFSGGFGVRQLGKPEKVDGDTLMMIASNTKALTTLLLARLVAEGKMTWDTPVTSLLPSFKLGDADTTKKVNVRQLICACTGLPRQDLEWLFEYKNLTPEGALATLGTMQPTSKFGELFQYSNPMAGAAGFTGGHVLYPDMELGAAYDKAMQTQVFDPLGMKATTFDYARALRGDHAMPHALDIDGKIAHAPMEMNYAVAGVRPAGAAWSTVRDMLAYVQMELAKGTLPGGKAYIGQAPLLAREAPQVAIGKTETYGMGLMVDTTYGVTVVHHGGDVFGFHSDVIWLPDQDVGAVVFTNGDGGSAIRDQFRRKLLEVLFDGKPQADEAIAADAKTQAAGLEDARKLLTMPADPAAAGKLAAKYSNAALGTIDVTHKDGKTFFEIGALKTEMATRKNPDGTLSFVTLAPGFIGFELIVSGDNLIVRDAQHEYIYQPVK